MKSFLDFLKYNNAVPFILFFLILGAGTAFATSPKLRQAVLAPEIPIVSPVPVKTDASKLLAQDLKDFDLALRIDSITEDNTRYYVIYSYRTLEVVESVWQETRKQSKMDVLKALLGKRDLKTYLTEQIGQVIDREITYLKEAQLASDTLSAPKKSSKYATLVGREIEKSDTKERRDAVKNNASGETRETPEQVVLTIEEQKKSQVQALLSQAEIRAIIVAAVAEFLAIDTGMPVISPEPVSIESPAPVPVESPVDVPVTETSESPTVEEEEETEKETGPETPAL